MSDFSDFSSLSSECGPNNLESLKDFNSKNCNMKLNKSLFDLERRKNTIQPYEDSNNMQRYKGFILDDDSSLDDFQFGYLKQEPALKLSCNLRNLILSTLNRHTILMKENVHNDQWFKNKIFDDNNRLIQLLLNLPKQQKHGEKAKQRFKVEECCGSADSANGKHQVHSSLQLEYKLRDRIVLNLMNNHHSIVLYDDATNSQKDQLVKENKELKQILINLPEIAEEVHEEVYDELYKFKSVNFVQPSQELGSSTNAKSSKVDKVANLSSDLIELKNILMNKLNNIDRSKEEAEFVLKVDNLSSLNLQETHYSKEFYCRDSKWRLGFKTIVSADDYKHLSVYLYCNDSFDFLFNFNVKTEFTLVKGNKYKGLVKSYEHLFSKNQTNWGYSKFILWEDLIKPENQYVIDDSFTLVANIKVGCPVGPGKLV